jgi:hypothetical protein
MRLPNLVPIFAIVGLGLATPSCTSSLELDRFRSAEASIDAISVNYFDVRFTAKAMTPHVNEYFEVRIVDKSNRVQAKAIYYAVTNPDFSLYLGHVLPKANPPYRIDFWADHNSSFKYDGIEGGINEKDHAWRRELSNPLPDDMRLTGSRYELDFLHDTAFVDIFTDRDGNKISGADTLLPCTINVSGAAAYGGKMMEFRIEDKASGRLVGLYRQGRASEAFKVQVTGILDSETPYLVSTYADVNDSGKYDEGDPSWKFDFVSTEQGILLDFNTGAIPPAPIDTGE